jgi:hypothetical protein
VDYTVEDYIWESKHRKHPINGIAQKGYFLSLFILNKRFSKTYTLLNKSVALQALTNLGPAEQLQLAVFPHCTRWYWVDMWSAHPNSQLLFQLSKPDRYFFIQVTTQFIRSRG